MNPTYQTLSAMAFALLIVPPAFAGDTAPVFNAIITVTQPGDARHQFTVSGVAGKPIALSNQTAVSYVKAEEIFRAQDGEAAAALLASSTPQRRCEMNPAGDGWLVACKTYDTYTTGLKIVVTFIADPVPRAEVAIKDDRLIGLDSAQDLDLPTIRTSDVVESFPASSNPQTVMDDVGTVQVLFPPLSRRL